jgi:hypothetical protein
MNKQEMHKVMTEVFEKCQQFREAGQKEYAHKEEDVFRNFSDTASLLDLTKEQVLLIFAKKHFDGIAAYVKGHRSQREDVRGRICDLIVYMCLLHGMIDENNNLIQLKLGSSRITGVTDVLLKHEGIERKKIFMNQKDINVK